MPLLGANILCICSPLPSSCLVECVCVVFWYILVLSRQEVFTPWWLGRLWGQVLSKTQHMRSVTWSASDMSWASLLVVHDHHSMSWPTFHRSPHSPLFWKYRGISKQEMGPGSQLFWTNNQSRKLEGWWSCKLILENRSMVIEDHVDERSTLMITKKWYVIHAGDALRKIITKVVSLN